MKKIVFTSILCLFFNIYLLSQENKCEFELFIGPNYFSTRGSETIKSFHFPSISYFTGVYIDYNILKKISLESGIQFEKNKIILKDLDSDLDNQIFGKINYDYLRLPITLKYYFNNKKLFYIKFGINFGALLRATETIFESETSPLIVRQDESYKTLDMGLSSGFGLNLNVSRKLYLNLSVIENLGLMNLIGLNNDSVFKTNGLCLSTGIAYKF